MAVSPGFGFRGPTPGCFSHECERKGVAGKAFQKLLKTKG